MYTPSYANRLLTRTVAPASEPVTLAEAKLYLRVDATTEDALINDLIVAARMAAEQWLCRSLITQTWKLAFDLGISSGVWLPMGSASAISSVVIVNKDTTTQTVSSSLYWLNAARNALIMDTIISGFRVEITYTAGYGDASAVPKPIKQGILAHIAALYDLRGEPGDRTIPAQAEALYAPFREMRL